MWSNIHIHTNDLDLNLSRCTSFALTHRGRDKMDAISQTTFSLKISLKFVPKVWMNNIPALVQIMAWRRPGDEPLSEPMMVSLLTHICITWPQWVKSVNFKHSYLEHEMSTQTLWNLYQNIEIFFSENAFENVICKIVASFAQASQCLVP